MAVNGTLPGTEQESPNPGTQEEAKQGPHDFLIDVLGKKFIIVAGDDPVFLDNVLSQYQMAVALTQGISGMGDDPLKVAILTGFMLCSEINKLKLQFKDDQAHSEGQRAGEEKVLHQITESLISRLDHIIENIILIDENPR